MPIRFSILDTVSAEKLVDNFISSNLSFFMIPQKLI